MHGAPALPEGFSHFPYADPAAPKGGRIVLGATGSFDSLNPLIIFGQAAGGVREYVFESLMARSLDEPFTLYGLIAERVEMPEDRREITFHLNPRAQFSDGTPLTADDVLFSWELLRDKGRRNHRTYYKKVTETQKLGPHTVRFVFGAADGDREMPLILGLMPVLPKHKFSAETFEQTTLEPLIGSGPYRIAAVDPGRSIAYVRNPDYWGRDLPVNRGRFNFDEIRYEYYRLASNAFEAFKSGAIDFRTEDDPSRWAEGYQIAAVTDGRIVKAAFATGLPAGMNGLVFNTRRAVFQDARVRRALIHIFDFESINRSFYHGLFRRTESYFERSVLSSAGKPATPREENLLAPFLATVKPEIRDGSFRFPQSPGSGYNRANWQIASVLLAEAGYDLRDGRLVHRVTGEPLTFEILIPVSGQERLVSSFKGDLKRLGITAVVRTADSTQYDSRLASFDFDMIQASWPTSLSPGNEQLVRWSAAAAREDGTLNYPGVASSAVDAMISALLAATTQEDFIPAVRALDRVLLSGDYVIPLFHLPEQWVAHWRYLEHPARSPLWGFTLDTWWRRAEP